jgi:hypothetical protein
MSLKNMIPKTTDIGREAIIVIAGALVAALVIGQLPGVRDWIKAQWSGSSNKPEETPWL